jgi:HPt (histidine-containing phosphotransfer) domain-containing protein
MQDRLNILLEKHCQTIKTNVHAVGRLLTEVAEGSTSDPLASVQAAEALAHQLKGSSGTAGFHELSTAATALDDCLKPLCSTDSSGVLAGIDEAMALYRPLEGIALETTPTKSALYFAV